MIVLVSVCNISWWMMALAMIVPAVLSWLLANTFAKEKNQAQRLKIKQLQAELKKSYEEKQIIKTKLVVPEVKFSDATNNSTRINTSSSKSDISGHTRASNKTNASKIIQKPKYPKLTDNLEIIEGIGPKMSQILKDNGIDGWRALSIKSPSEIKQILNKYGDRYRIIDPKTWPLQAELASQNMWDELIAHQQSEGPLHNKNSSKVGKLLVKYGYIKKWNQDDLKAIEGIGPKIASLLKDAEITTWNQLANTKVDKIKSILSKAGKRYALATPETWPAQAKLAAEGNFSELERYQSEMKRN